VVADRVASGSVIERAGNRCEYCGPAQTGQEAAFQIDQVAPAIVGGKPELWNTRAGRICCR